LTAIFVILGLLFFLLPQNSLAASFSNLSDKMSRHAPSTGADHEIKFTTSENINQTTHSLTLNFASGFDLTSLDLGDIDFFHGTTGTETEELLSVNPTALSWGVVINPANIIFSHPSSALNGNVNSGEVIVIRIGLNASGADAQIINPAVSGSKLIEITSSFGGSGKLAVPVSQDQVGVSAASGNLPPAAITLYPPSNITTNSMNLSWSQYTSLDFARYELYYSTLPGVTSSNGILLVTYNSSTATIYPLNGLNANTSYYFVVYVYNTPAGLSTPSNEVMGRTLSTGGPPVVTQPAMPTLDHRVCPIFLSDYNLTGTRPADTIVFVNDSSAGVNYPAINGWTKFVTLNLGPNAFAIYVRDLNGAQSDTLMDTINRWRKGDTNGNFVVDDYDLSGLAAHFWSDWCYADFNEDKYVDDFDLSALAINWDFVY